MRSLIIATLLVTLASAPSVAYPVEPSPVIGAPIPSPPEAQPGPAPKPAPPPPVVATPPAPKPAPDRCGINKRPDCWKDAYLNNWGRDDTNFSQPTGWNSRDI